ncbi:MAG: patatin family protein [Oscillospiraceae bacterium]|jgi:predicted patatin/cPLA2 family phospholipase|nr:patatin family protein [Oscillospiraceae bacterium]
MTTAGLILEGGGMRGIYTAGVLDFFLDAGLTFPAIYGVSAGVCHACSFVSEQRGRARATVMDYAGTRQYASVYNLITTGDFFGSQFVYHDVPDRLLPFDYDAFADSPQTLYSVVTNIETGLPEYIPLGDLRQDMIWVQASASLPLLARTVKLGGKKYLDGGMSDSIPLARSIADGNQRNVLVLTRHNGYRKEPSSQYKLIRMRYGKYPEFVAAAKTRHTAYNASLNLAEAEAAAGRAVIIHPQEEVHLGRLERDKGKLSALYELGFADARAAVEGNTEFFAG